MSGVRVRFAPSPTGSLHLGNARTALFNWLFARRNAGVFVLRIEDTDVDREVEGADRSLQEDLRWLGLDWDEGPDIGGPFGPYRQSERAGIYAGHRARLLASGAAYPCFCPPEELEEDRRRLAAAGRTPRYSGRCATIPRGESEERLAGGEPAAIRLRMGAVPSVRDMLRGNVDFSARESTDPVIFRRDGRPTYNLAVVVDDLSMKITHVLRGDDHLSNTPVQMRIYEALGENPPQFAHLPSVLGPDGSPLSKRHGAVSLGEMRRRGYPPVALAQALMMLGWTPPGDVPPPLAAAASHFDLERVSLSASIFDPARLDYLSALWIGSLDPQRRAREALPFLGALFGGGDATRPEPWGPAGLDWLGRVLDLWSGQVSRFTDYSGHAEFVFRFEECLAAASDNVRAELRSGPVQHVLEILREEIEAAGGPLDTKEQYSAVARRAGQRAKARGRDLYHPIRIAVTAADSGPELQRLIPLIEEGAGLPLPLRPLPVMARIGRALALAEGPSASGSRPSPDDPGREGES